MTDGVQLADLVTAVRENRMVVTGHAAREMKADSLLLDEVCESISSGEIINHYQDDTPYPSCLVLSRDWVGDPIHSVWAYNDEERAAVLVTVYRPDPDRWLEWRFRKKLQ